MKPDRPLQLDEDESNSGPDPDRCLRADVALFVLKAYMCVLNLRMCCVHLMDAGDGESTQKMRGRCKSLGTTIGTTALLERRTLKPRKR